MLVEAFTCAPAGPHYFYRLTAFVKMGLAPLDRPHRDLERCIRDLAEAVRARDLALVRGRACMLVEMLGEHFEAEEEMMRATGWSQIARHKECHARLLFQARRFERLVAVSPLTPDIASWAMNRLPELIRYHMIATDFGFARHAVRVSHDHRPRLARRRESPVRRG
jgi:hemerythrin-like metal-binding protein